MGRRLCSLAMGHALAKRSLPSLSGYFRCTSCTTFVQVGSSRWHQWHLRIMCMFSVSRLRVTNVPSGRQVHIK